MPMTLEQIRAQQQGKPAAPTSTPGRARSFSEIKGGNAAPAPTPAPAPQGPGFVQSAAQAIARPFLRLATNARNAYGVAVGEEGAQTKERSFGYFGTVKPVGQEGSAVQRLKDAGGTALEVASYLPIGGGTLKAGSAFLRGAVTEGGKAGLKAGAAAGAMQGAGQALQDDAGLAETAIRTGAGAAVGGAVGLTLGAAAPIATRATGKAINSLAAPGTELLRKPGQALQGVAANVQKRIIKPTRVDIRNGYKDEYIKKYKIFGSLSDSLNRTTTLLRDANQSLQRAIQKEGDAPRMTLTGTIEKLAEETKTGAGDVSAFGGIGARQKAVQEIEDELGLLFGEVADDTGEKVPMWKTREMSFPELIQLKRAVGLKAAFEHDPLRSGPNPKEEIYNRLYQLLKDETEKMAGPEFREINRTISELIPVEQALIRRIPVAERQNAIGLIDTISIVGGMTTDPSAFLLTGVNQGFKTGLFSKALGAAGEKLDAAGAAVDSVYNPLGKAQPLRIQDQQSTTQAANQTKGQNINDSVPRKPLPLLPAPKAQVAVPGRTIPLPAAGKPTKLGAEIVPRGGKYGETTQSAFGAVGGFERDEEGNVTFDPEKAALSMAGVAGITRSQAIQRIAKKLDEASIEELARFVQASKQGLFKPGKDGRLSFARKDVREAFDNGMAYVGFNKETQDRLANATISKITAFFDDIIQASAPKARLVPVRDKKTGQFRGSTAGK